MDQADLKEILRGHVLWLISEPGGERADLCGADLCGANLCGANLRGANLRDANLCEALMPDGWEVYQFNGMGSAGRLVTVLCNQDLVFAGCFKGTIDEFFARAETEGKQDYLLQRPIVDWLIKNKKSV